MFGSLEIRYKLFLDYSKVNLQLSVGNSPFAGHFCRLFSTQQKSQILLFQICVLCGQAKVVNGMKTEKWRGN